MLAKLLIESLARSVEHGEAAGLSVETIVILDRSDVITRDIVLKHLSGRFLDDRDGFRRPWWSVQLRRRGGPGQWKPLRECDA